MNKLIHAQVLVYIASLLGCLVSSRAIAQTAATLPNANPNPDRFPQALPTPQPLPPETPDLAPTPTPTPLPEPSSVKISVRKIEVVDGTLLTPEEIARITQPVEGKTVTLEDLRSVADAITQLYLSRGYITSRAVVGDQTIVDGIVQIRVIEGSIEAIDVQGLERLKPFYVRDRVSLGTATPLNKDKLEDQLRLLKVDPLFEAVEASLRPGTGLGQSILTVRVREAAALNGYFGADNYSPPSVGSERFGSILSYRNLTGLGDELSASYFRTTQGGYSAFDFNYRIPVNGMNGTLQLRAAPSRSEIIEPRFAAFGIRSDSSLYELSYRQPILRSPREEVALSLGFAVQNGQTFLFQSTPFPFGIGPDPEGNSRTRVLKIGQDYIKRDLQGAWALRSQFSIGLGVFSATTNPKPLPDGQFVSWLGQVQRVQRLGTDHLLIAQADVQLTPDSLLPSQQFVIGGGQTLRGYRQNARSGDNGVRVSFEDRIAIQRNESGVPIFQLAPFIDFGTVWNRSDNPNILPNQTLLAGAGLGVLLEPFPGFTVRLDYAVPFVHLRDRGENAQERAFYFSAGYSF
ncbi:ShlB/FhaC/HecB family hemolysin secretion/activation protein [Myxacorys almedinensis]|uniref:BamA/TamA family outer membrane protein n=1 Tax=Myxacorys almedinensis A TaxID=2690445 RepID=A0A8J7Z143_9CYAN|nr:ShlB/FhaC/HecB family hemolysin secretion/activation protein [Myxacorys almedinensis]NDJ17230.1 BamA/TamA family outer membrane protein [Myxacorys almedinensis A]